MQYRDSKTGHFVSAVTYKRSRARGGTRYKKVYSFKNREYLIFLFNDPNFSHKENGDYLSDHNEGKWAQAPEASEETEEIAQEKFGERSRSPRILVIYKNKIKNRPASDRTIINFCIVWINDNAPEWEFITWELTGGTRIVVVARGKLTKNKMQVILGNA